MSRVRLFLFPALEAGAFAGAALLLAARRPAEAAILFALASLAMCFTLHVAVHELVHHPPENGALAAVLRAASTLLLGVPFHGYLCHHGNHHRHANSLEDWSTTWKAAPSGPVPRNALAYCLRWPVALADAQPKLRASIARGDVPAWVVRGIRRDQWLLALFLTGGVIAAPLFAAGYLASVYVAWALIARHNYGQHPPREYGSGLTTSFSAPLYNALTCNNGLHAEHHRDPSRTWDALAPAPDAAAIRAPHLLA